MHRAITTCAIMNKFLENAFKNVKSIEQYEAFSEEVMNLQMKVPINMTTALCLVKFRSLEIQYYKKYKKNGAACYLLEYILRLPPSKKWMMLQKELVGCLQYWLQTALKQGIDNNTYWWNFLCDISQFIEEISFKHPSIPDILVKKTSESLIQLGMNDGLNSMQRHEVLYCICLYCARASRETRAVVRQKCTSYLTKLAEQLCWCGYQPLQFCALETLLRFLVPRRDPKLCAEAASSWFPAERCPQTVRDIFLRSSWTSFFQSSRLLLNALNDAIGMVTSIPFKTLAIGDNTIISTSDNLWVDINAGANAVSVMIDPPLLRFAGHFNACQALVVHADSTRSVNLHSGSGEIKLSVDMSQPPQLLPKKPVFTDACSVTIVMDSTVDLAKLGSALRIVFGYKYQESGTRFSTPAEANPGWPISCGVPSPRDFNNHNSPSPTSTTSTTSLAQLQDKLKALPPQERKSSSYYNITAEPKLATIPEISDTDDQHSIHSQDTIKLTPFDGDIDYRPRKKADSDSELTNQKTGKKSGLPVVKDHAISCLFNTGSDSQDTFHETIEHFSKRKDFQTKNIVDLLIQEASEAQAAKDSERHERALNNVDDSEGIENTPITDNRNVVKRSRKLITTKKPCTVVSTTEDESNTEAIEVNALKLTSEDDSNNEVILDTPAVVHPNQFKTRQHGTMIESEPNKTFDVQHVEGFISKHIGKTKTGTLKPSPALAKKMKSPTCNTSKNFDENLIANYASNLDLEYFDAVITECVRDMIDHVCNELSEFPKIHSKERYDNNKPEKNPIESKKLLIKKKKNTIKNTTKSTVSSSSTKATTDVNSKGTNEQYSDQKRKRKLYSPVNDAMNVERIVSQSDNDDEDNIVPAHLRPKLETPKTRASCYKEISIEKQRRIRLPRGRKSRVQFQKSPSPATVENDAIFDKLKSTIEINEKTNFGAIKSAYDVYNFSSDTEDQDFEMSKMKLRKKLYIKPVDSEPSEPTGSEGLKKPRPRRKLPGKSSNDNTGSKIRQSRKKAAPNKNKTKIKIAAEAEKSINLDDERMRDPATEELLNSSMIVANQNDDSTTKDTDFAIDMYPEMQHLLEEQVTPSKQKTHRKQPNKRTKRNISRKGKDATKNKDRSQTLSPLPELIVETKPTLKTKRDDLEEKIFREISEKENYRSCDDYAIELNEMITTKANPKKKAQVISKVKDKEIKRHKIEDSDSAPSNAEPTVSKDREKHPVVYIDPIPRHEIERMSRESSKRQSDAESSENEIANTTSTTRKGGISPFPELIVETKPTVKAKMDKLEEKIFRVISEKENYRSYDDDAIELDEMITTKAKPNKKVHTKSKVKDKEIKRHKIEDSDSASSNAEPTMSNWWEKQPVVYIEPIPRDEVERLSRESSKRLSDAESSINEIGKYVNTTRKCGISPLPEIIFEPKPTLKARVDEISENENYRSCDDYAIKSKPPQQLETETPRCTIDIKNESRFGRERCQRSRDLLNEKQPVVSIVPIPRDEIERLSRENSKRLSDAESSGSDIGKYVNTTRKRGINAIYSHSKSSDGSSDIKLKIPITEEKRVKTYSRNVTKRNISEVHVSGDNSNKSKMPRLMISPIDDAIFTIDANWSTNVRSKKCMPDTSTKVAEIPNEPSSSGTSVELMTRQESPVFRRKTTQSSAYMDESFKRATIKKQKSPERDVKEKKTPDSDSSASSDDELFSRKELLKQDNIDSIVNTLNKKVGTCLEQNIGTTREILMELLADIKKEKQKFLKRIDEAAQEYIQRVESKIASSERKQRCETQLSVNILKEDIRAVIELHTNKL